MSDTTRQLESETSPDVNPDLRPMEAQFSTWRDVQRHGCAGTESRDLAFALSLTVTFDTKVFAFDSMSETFIHIHVPDKDQTFLRLSARCTSCKTHS